MKVFCNVLRGMYINAVVLPFLVNVKAACALLMAPATENKKKLILCKDIGSDFTFYSLIRM